MIRGFEHQCWDPVQRLDILGADFSSQAQEIAAQFTSAVNPVETKSDNDIKRRKKNGKAKPCSYVRRLCSQKCYFQGCSIENPPLGLGGSLRADHSAQIIELK